MKSIGIKCKTWYTIPQFRGYEFYIDTFNEILTLPRSMYMPVYYIDTEKHIVHSVRSFKQSNKYRNGYYLPYEHKTNNGKSQYYYELTNYELRRKRLKAEDIIKLIEKYPEYTQEMPDVYYSSTCARHSVVPYILPENAGNIQDSKIKNNSASSLFKNLINKK